jgi:trk system potassium uptake protein TrkH
MFADIEWRTYFGLILIVTLLIMAFGLANGDFRESAEGERSWGNEAFDGFRYGLFQVVAIITTTGFGTDDFDAWNDFGRGVLFLLMFVGGCSGSTGGGLKVIRHVLFVKILKLEIEHSYHPRVIRPLKIGGRAVEDPDLRRNILVYFCLILIIFVLSWLFIITVEPDATWGNDPQHKLLDSATAVAATLNNIGPGLGTVGATQNYGHFSGFAKMLYVWLMMLGRVEIFAIVVLFVPDFWRSR